MEPSIVLLALMAVFSQAQLPYTEYGQQTERGGTRVAFWDNQKNQAAGQAAIDFGRPLWKPEYAEQLDAMTSGKIWRMGENFWTTLDSNIPLTIGGVDVPVGYHYLAVKRSEDGTRWSLAFIDPAETRKRVLDAFEVGTRPAEIPVRFEAPLSFETVAEPHERLAIALTEESLRIQWGTFTLSAPVSVTHR